MTPIPEVQERLRRYLLGQLTDDAREEVEKDLLASDEVFEELLVVEDELVDQYLHESLEAADRTAFESHFLATPDRQDKLKFGRAFNRYLSTHAVEPAEQKVSTFAASRGWTQTLFSPPLRIGIFAILVVGIAFGVWRIFLHQSEVDKGLIALNAAYREKRPVESRISALSYAPFSQTRGGPDDHPSDALARDRAELILNTAAGDTRNAAAHHALGQVFLAKKDFDRAIREFEIALASDSKNAKLHSDLGAAWLERGKVDLDGKEPGKGMEEMGRSLENLNQALLLDPNLTDALFNRALCRQHQKLFTQAKADWQEYLKKDPNSQWANEAKENLKILESRPLSGAGNQQPALDRFLRAFQAGDDGAAWEVYTQSYTSTDNRVTRDLVDNFLQANLRSETSDNLRALSYLSQLQLRKTGDTYNSELARVYSSAPPEMLTRLSKAREQVKKGYEVFRQGKITESMESFQSARETFDAAGDSAEALLADYSIAYGATIQPDLEKGEQIFDRIIPLCKAKGYKWILAQSLAERAHLQSNLNNYSQAINDGAEGLRLFEELQDQNGTMGSVVQLASLYLFLNDSEKSLSFIQRGIAMANEQAPTQLWGMYIAAAFNFVNLHLYLAALDYQGEALRIALDSRNPLYISRSYEYTGQTYGRLQLYEEAIQSVQHAYEQGKALTGERLGKNMMANASLKLGDLYRLSGDQQKALAAYEESDSRYQDLGFAHYRYLAHKGQFLSYLAKNDNLMASRELAAVLQLFEGYRQKILEERQRMFFFDKEQDTYDLAIDFAYTRAQDPIQAFEYSESSRARSLLDLLHNGGLVVEINGRTELRLPSAVAESLPLEKIREMLPDEVQILQYAVLKDKTIIWLIARSGVTPTVVNIDSTKLAADIADSLRLIASQDETAAANKLKYLHDILIRPIETSLNPNKLLCIVPDKDLNYVPFDALISAKSGRYMVQDYRLMLSPSTSVFIHCSAEAKKKGSNKTERLLAVGNPSFDREAYPQYPNLEAAEREADGIARFYTAPRVLIKGQPTAELVKAELARAEVAHFAAHYVIDQQSSLSSKLLLASSGGSVAERGAENGQLESRDVCRMKLSRTRLVVLSACQTGIERQYGGEGPASFARQFIIAGVPVIVASLWPVDSEPTAQLMIAFHRHRQTEGVPTAEALRRAQQEMIEGSDPRYRRPFYWASFMTIGGYAAY